MDATDAIWTYLMTFFFAKVRVAGSNPVVRSRFYQVERLSSGCARLVLPIIAHELPITGWRISTLNCDYAGQLGPLADRSPLTAGGFDSVATPLSLVGR